MPLAGEQLTIKEALALCHVAGFDPKTLDVAVAVMTAESGRYTEAWHDNLDADGNVISTDRGLFQINDKAHPDFSDAEAYDPRTNAVFAFNLSMSGSDWHLWAAYNSGAYQKYLATVREVRLTTDWRSREKLYS